MMCSALSPPVPLYTGEFKIGFISCVVIMLLMLCYQSQFMVYKSVKTFQRTHDRLVQDYILVIY